MGYSNHILSVVRLSLRPSVYINQLRHHFSKSSLYFVLHTTLQDYTFVGVRRENEPIFVEKPMNILRNPAETHSAENKETPTPEPHVQNRKISKIQPSPETNEKQDEDIETNSENNDFEEYAISKIKDAVNELLNEHDLRPRITFLDFAGQSMYYAFHQMFLRPKSCSILVVDMTKRLDDKVDVKNKDETDCSLFASWRYRGNKQTNLG